MQATPGSLRHEVFHSWWGRGVKPAGQADAWWDEGWNVNYDNAATGTRAFDFAEPPRALSVSNRYSRVTPTAAYTDGERFFEGVAAQLTPDVLKSIMNQFYLAHLAGRRRRRRLRPTWSPAPGRRAGGRVSPLGVRTRRSGPRAGAVLPD